MNLSGNRLKALLFDVDGTLAETEELHRLAFNAAFAGLGLDWHWNQDLYRELLQIAGGRERIHAWLAQAHPRLLEQPGINDRIAVLHRLKTDHYTAGVAAGRMALRPGVARLIGEARSAGLRLAIVTTTSRANVDALLAATLGTDWEDRFDAICSGDEGLPKKPAPDAYRWTLDRLGLDGGDCVAIEDTANGVQAARAAGVPVLVTESLYSRGEDFDGALAVLSSLGEPGQPFHVVAGKDPGADWVDLALLRRLLC